MKNKIFPILLLLAITVTLFSGCFAGNNTEPDLVQNADNLYTDKSNGTVAKNPTETTENPDEKYNITVRLLTDGNITVISKNPITVSYGEPAVFEVLFNDNYSYAGTDFEGA